MPNKPTGCQVRNVNEYMKKGPPLQTSLWDKLVWARTVPNLLIPDNQQAFFQVGLKQHGRDVFRFVFQLLYWTVKQFRFSRIPFGQEAHSYLLGDNLQYLYNNQPQRSYMNTLLTIIKNTCVDSPMKTGNTVEQFDQFERSKISST